jgi:hypothetical protein
LTAVVFLHLADDEDQRFASEGISRQLDWIQELAREQIRHDAQLVDSLMGWTVRVREAARQRNRVLHGSWSRDPDEPADKLSKIGFGRGDDHHDYTLIQLHDIAVSFAELARDSQELSDDVGDYFIFRLIERREEEFRSICSCSARSSRAPI